MPAARTSFVAAQLRRAPWYLLAAAIHAAGILLAIALVTGTAPQVEVVRVAVPAPAPPPPTPPLPPPLPPVQVEAGAEGLLPAVPALTELPPPPPEPDRVDAVGGVDPLPADQALRQVVVPPPPLPPRFGLRGATRPDLGAIGRAGALPLELALGWLQAHQDQDGRFDASGFMRHDPADDRCTGPGSPLHDIGATGLALLAFLGDGSTLQQGRWQANLRAGVLWLRSQQEASGRFGTGAATDFLYDHAIATLAMTEAAGTIRSPLLLPCAQRGLDYLAACRNADGVWRYEPRGGQKDTSLTGWCATALATGQAFGLPVDPQALAAVLTWLDQVTDRSGRAGYTLPGELSSRHPGDHGVRFPPARGEALTAVGLWCRHLLGQDPARTPVMGAATQLILQRPPVWDPAGGAVDEYYWYYGSHALYQQGDRPWQEWQRRLVDVLAANQRLTGSARGSWDPVGVWGQDGGRVCATALLALALESGFRFARQPR